MATQSTAISTSGRTLSSRGVLALCFVVALLEGVDGQSMGAIAPSLAADYGLDPWQVGLALSASLVGLLIGASAGGVLADRFGRKFVLIASVVLLGVFSLATTIASDLASLLAIRFLAGLGMGGALPTLIAIAGETVEPSKRSTAISLMYCGIPLGGALAGALVTATIGTYGWRPVLYVGGFGPIVVAPLLVLLPSMTRRAREHREAQHQRDMSILVALFGEKRALTTSLIWLSSFLTLLIVYLLLNWLPSLMVANGFSKPQASSLAIVLNLGAAAGCVLLGMLMDRKQKRSVILFAYSGMAVALCGLAFLHSYAHIVLAAIVAGFFVIGGQLILYALTASYYPTEIRGTGIGAAVSVGRFGAIAGPLLAGKIMSAGSSATAVLLATIPCMVVASLAAIALLARPTATD